ncbi:Por secretion system C-terminal sorting domain-containing protein [Robiginitalea myxolifaciens]|uniref:Por secretion system C-terminal sorting domain-containing protein n=1 Tax=Robiginitalea myxolifaciens TaxID=400055 RepID=A0A1I6H391_9FLAO|nr:malectin domain-containing carbohydrate-binding protein [Robiginitalea myxolifaciens]SFR48975.1 Por secretion system C-terminal sorting domain-containing protein [Robiginitalea myxolifaciens]
MEVLVRLCQAFYDVRTRISGPTKLQTIPVEDHVRNPKKVPPRRIPKTLLTLLGALFLFGGGATLEAQTGPDFIITPANATVDVNEQFSVTVQIVSNGFSYNSANANISFDETKLQVQGVTKAGPLDLNGPIAEQFDNTAGNVRHGAGIQNTFISTPVVDFLVIDFIATEAGVVNLEFFDFDQFSATQIIGSSFANILDAATGATITIGNPPVADFTIVPNPAEVNEVVQFTSTSTDIDGTIDNYEWDFGDGSPVVSGMSESAPTHTYSAPNTYTVSLTVTDNDGFTSTEMKNITVEEVMVTLFDITASSGPGGSISPDGTVQVMDGGSQLFTFTPDPGFEVAEVLVNGSPVAIAGSYEFTNVTSAQSISVSFEEIPPFQVCIASGNVDLVAFGRDFIGDLNNAPPTVSEFSRTNGKAFKNYSGSIGGTASGSPEELLFQKEIYGGAGGTNPAFTYEIPVENGTYQVDLYFAEVFHPSSGGRVFDVFLEDELNPILDEYDLVDPVKDGLNSNQTAIIRTYNVTVTDGSLTLQIGPASVDNGKLSGICVTASPGANLHPITNIGDLTVAVGEPAMAPVNVSDPESDPLTVTLNGLPASLSYNPATGQIEGTPLIGDIGTYTVNAIISDGTSSPVTEQFTLTVDPPEGDDPPAIDSIDDVFANEGELISIPIVVTDDFNPAASIEIFDISKGGTNPFTPTELEAVGTLNDNGGGSYTFEWTPAVGSGRSYWAVVTANDGVNLPQTESFRINVSQPLPGVILARTFFNPDPWYGGNPDATAGFTVAIEATAAQNIGWIDSGEFVDYWINVPTAGAYDVRVKAAKGSAGTTIVDFQENNGVFTSIGNVSVPQSPTPDRWQNYFNQTGSVVFTNAGPQVLRLSFNGGANIEEIEFTASFDPFFTAELEDQQNLEGETPMGLSVTATDPDGGVVTYSDNGTLPPGLSIDPTTGAISGTIDVGAAANSPYAVTITVTDDEMDTGTTTFNWTILEVISTPICVNVGNEADVTAFGRSFGNDDPFVTDFQANFNTTNPISGTLPGSGEEMMFQSEKNASAASGTLSFAFPTGNGEFTVELYMAEIYVGAPGGGSGLGTGDRLFDIDVEGTTETGVDLFDTYGTLQGVTKTFAVTVSDGILNIDLSAQVDRAKLSGICITPTADFVPNAAPTLEIAEWTPVIDCEGDGEDITLMASASDTEQGDLSSIIVWRNGLGEVVETGATLNLTAFTGSDTFTAEVVDATPSMASESILIDVDNADPVLADVLANPAGGVDGTIVTLSATASDEEDGDITANIVWTSDLDGSLGSGGSVMATLSIGVHTITASITDACGVEITEEITVEIVDDLAPVVVITGPTDINVSRGVPIAFSGTANDDVDGDISANLSWFTDDTQETIAPGGTGANKDITFVRPGSTEVNAEVTDSNGQTGSDTFTVNVSAPEVTFIAPVESEELTSLTVNVEVDPTDVLFGNAEHFHFYINPANVGAPDSNTRISSALTGAFKISDTQFVFDENSGALAANGAGNGIVEGFNTIVVVVADQFHQEFPNAEATALVTFTVDLPDLTDPMAMCQDIQVALGADGSVTILPSEIDGGSTDDEGIASLSLDIDTFTGVNLGENEVTLTVTDTSGNTDSCVATVTVVDNTNPVASCITDEININLGPDGMATLDAASVDGGSSDNDGIASISVFPNTFDCSSLGTQTVTLTVMDNAGNMDTCTTTVTVNDVTAPVVTCEADINLSSPSGVSLGVDITPPSVMDECDSSPTLTGVATRPDMTTFNLTDQPANYVFPTGSTKIVWTSMDAYGNTGTCTQFVNIAFTPSTASQITAFSVNGVDGDIVGTDITVLLPFGTPLTALEPSVTISEFASVVPNSGTAEDFSAGPVPYTVTAQDNTSQTVYSVTINAQPDADAGPDQIVVDLDGNGTEAVTLDGSASSDEGSIVSYVWTIGTTEIATGASPVFAFAQGVNNVTLTVTDNLGATATDTVVITVNPDNGTPTIECPELIAALDADANCTAQLPDFTGSVTAGDDLDPNPVVTQSPVAGSLVADGDLITLTVTDATGNSASCSFNISVIDNLAPVVQNPPAMTLDLKCASEVPAAAMLTALDNCDGSLMEMPSDDLTPGATANEFTIERTWTFTDTAGNSTSFVQTINVDDDVDPEFLVCLGAQTVVGDEDGFATLANYVPQVSATDNCGGVPVLVQSPAPGTIISGANTVTITATDEAGNNMTCSFDVSVDDPTPDPLEIVEFILVDADDNVDLFTITDGMLIDVNSLPTANLNIRAVEGPTTESVVMQISGPLNKSQTESFAPYALYGDAAGNYNAQVFPLGTYNLTGTAYTGNGGTGTPGAPGNVTFTFTDVNPACVDFDAVLADSGDPTSCGGDEGFAQINVSGSDSAVSYSWSHDNSLSGSVAEGLEAGSYTVTVTNEDGCLDIVSFTLSDPAGPTVTLAPFANVLDTDATFALSGGSPAGGTYSGPGVSGGNFNPAIGAGTYPITYTYADGNGCSGSATRNITVTSELGNAVLIVLDATTDTELFALTDGLVIYKSDIGNTPLGVIYNADLNPGGVNFKLTGPINEMRSEGPAPHSLFGDIGVDIQGKVFPVGNYTLIANAVSPAGIDITVNFSIVDQDPQCIGFDAALASKTNPTTCSGTDGSIMVSVSGGATPYSYSWSHNAGLDSPTASGLAAGNYSVTVTDANGCTDTVTTSISNPAAPVVTLANFAPVLESDAPFMLTGGSPAGGVYSGTGVSGGMFNPGVGPGTYTITYSYTDGTTGCSASASKNITVTSELGEAVLIVLDATTDTELFALTDGMVIFKDDIGNTPLGVIYNASLNPNGVFFNLSGPINENRSEGPAPHSLFGDIGVDIQGKPFPIGNYTLTANAISPSAPDVTVNFSVVAGSGAAREAVSKMLPMTASPTPADVEVSISFDVPTRIETFQIFDTSGKLVKTVRAAQGTNLRTYDLRVLELPSGMYYVRTKDDEGNSYQEAILISRY